MYGQHMMYGQWGALALVWGLVWIAVVGTGLLALWRGMLAQERMARHLEAIERALVRRGEAS
jgi:hypothetical protein